jgi:hypothetical protein
MFNAGIEALLAGLPEFRDASPQAVKRLLTSAFLDVTGLRGVDGSSVDAERRAADLRRLATGLELHALLVDGLSEHTFQACAFVAAEALEVAREAAEFVSETPEMHLGPLLATDYAAIEAASLYFIAGFDANAAVAVRQVGRRDGNDDAEPLERWWAARALRSIRAFFELRSVPSSDVPTLPDGSLSARVRAGVWRRIAQAVDVEIQWLRLERDCQGSREFPSCDDGNSPPCGRPVRAGRSEAMASRWRRMR